MVRTKELAEGVIRRDELYTIERVKRLLGLTDSAMRSLRIEGLPVIRFGKRAFVSGCQMIDFLEGLNHGASKGQSGLPFGEGQARPPLEGPRDGRLEGASGQEPAEEGSRQRSAPA